MYTVNWKKKNHNLQMKSLAFSEVLLRDKEGFLVAQSLPAM